MEMKNIIDEFNNLEELHDIEELIVLDEFEELYELEELVSWLDSIAQMAQASYTRFNSLFGYYPTW